MTFINRCSLLNTSFWPAADDLPLNVSRETLQSGRFLTQIRNVLISRAISLLARISEEDPEKYNKIMEVFGTTFKIGAVESQKDRQKIASLTRWSTNFRNSTSLDEVRLGSYVGEIEESKANTHIHPF